MRIASTSKRLVLALALSSASACANAGAGPEAAPSERGRIMPPAQVRCDRSQLTSYFGDVTAYKRGKVRVWLRIATDYGTLEEVTAIDPAEKDPANLFLYQGQAFTSADWQRIERKPGVLRKGTRATAWVCRDGKTPPLIDWNGATE
jgi:hypothetical protein